MRRRHRPLPKRWLMTDERLADQLLPAISRLPRGKAGVVWRNYRTPEAERRALYDKVRAIARRNRLILLVAGRGAERARGADGWHGGKPRPASGAMIRSFAVHNRCDLARARQARADLIFVSPVFATRSHPRARPLGPIRFGLLAARASMMVIALGGMTPGRWARIKALGADGYAAIDAWLKSAASPLTPGR